MPKIILKLVITQFMLLTLTACGSSIIKKPASTDQLKTVLAVFAHPDDETWISGTLAKLASSGLKVIPLYVTSGDAGSDYSGANLSGLALAKAREVEAINATQILGLSDPVFLRFPDSKVGSYRAEIHNKLNTMIAELKPVAVMTFGADGITGHTDHINVGNIASNAALGKSVHFVISQRRADQLADYAKQQGQVYQVKNAISDREVSYQIDVSSYTDQRINAQAAYKTQFPPIVRHIFSEFAHGVSIEELQIPGNSPVLQLFIEKLEVR